MNKTSIEALDFVKKLSSFLDDNALNSCSIAIAPPSIHLPILHPVSNHFDLVSQNIAFENAGAYTGETAAFMLHEYVNYTLVGHSERRLYFNDTDSSLHKKLILALQYDLKPIFCFGETKQERDAGNYLSVIKKQLDDTIMLLPESAMSNILLAYEPIWAIGTGNNALISQIEEVHSYVRQLVVHENGLKNPETIPILYGGSCSADNAALILDQKHVNGLLIGGASLDFDHFCKIIQIAGQIN